MALNFESFSGLFSVVISFYHPAAIASLSRNFADRRGFAVSLHGTGGSIGETAAPILVGALLKYTPLIWSSILQISIIPAIVFGILMISLGFVFYTESKENGFWYKFYKIIPGLLMCYFIPAIFNSLGVISSEESQTYYIASRYLLPASLLLMTLKKEKRILLNFMLVQ